jgi:3-methyl-2-oxobutanoate hydroxymethyltransferase
MNDRIAQFQAAKGRGERLAVLTAYDYPQARLLEESGVDALLVGDSLGMVVLGYPDTTLVTSYARGRSRLKGRRRTGFDSR